MTTMMAYRLVGWREPARFEEVPVPRPGPGEALVKVAGVGLCHTDVLFLESPEGAFPYELPMTLGHEIAGTVHEVGEGVGDLAPGDDVVVKSRNSCGTCSYCLRGFDNYCTTYPFGFGSGLDGGLSPLAAFPRRCLVRLRTLDPVQAGPLADAGCTSYHAVTKALPKLGPGTTAVVIGAGGLGGYALQYLRLLSAAQVIAVDVAAHRLALASDLGAHHTISSDGTALAQIRDLTAGTGADAVFDFVGTDDTMRLALASARTLGIVALVGAGGGTGGVAWGTVARECEVYIPMGGTLKDLHDVVALAEAGRLTMRNELFRFEETPAAYERLRVGDLDGRAVVMPNE